MMYLCLLAKSTMMHDRHCKTGRQPARSI